MVVPTRQPNEFMPPTPAARVPIPEAYVDEGTPKIEGITVNQGKIKSDREIAETVNKAAPPVTNAKVAKVQEITPVYMDAPPTAVIPPELTFDKPAMIAGGHKEESFWDKNKFYVIGGVAGGAILLICLIYLKD